MFSSLSTFLPRDVSRPVSHPSSTIHKLTTHKAHTLWHHNSSNSHHHPHGATTNPYTSATLNPPHGAPPPAHPHQHPPPHHGPNTTAAARRRAAARRSSAHGASARDRDRDHDRAADVAPPTALAALAAEEALLARRKEHIQRFGAAWLRPPGVAKTLQAGLDEALERAEQEALGRREREREREALAVEGQALVGVVGLGEADEEMGMGMERDLDGEVPDGEGAGLWGDGEQDEDEDEVDVMVAGGLGGAEMDEDEERDLDDEVPEAGSYQHTDTDVEDESTDDDGGGIDDDPSGLPSTRGMTVVQDMTSGFRRGLPGGLGHGWLGAARGGGVEGTSEMRLSLDGGFDDAQFQAESSLLFSSPSDARAIARGRRSDQ